MPLDGERPRRRAVRSFDALDDAVLRPCRGAERRGELADRLMVAAVDAAAHPPEGVIEQALRLDAQGMAGARVGVVNRAPPALARGVLVQRSARGAVQGLDAAVGGGDRNAAPVR